MSSLIGFSNVSRVTYPCPAWRYLLLFQSWSQFQSWALVMIAAILLIHLILELLPKTGLPIEGVLAGAVLGSLCSVIMVLPAQFSVRPHSTALFGLLTSGLDELGYVPLNSQTGAVVYRQNLPGFLRWHEGNVSIERSGDCLFVKGALAIVIKIRLSLLRRIAA